MPWKVIRTKKGYGVKNTETGKMKSSNTTLAKAKGQINLLRGVKHGWHPTKVA